jgi:hypothetical protein
VPTRRIWRYKPRVEPITALEWAFFLVRDKTGFDRIWENNDGGGLFMLYYADHWKQVYAAHREEIDAEWNRRGWTAAQRQFVLTPYMQRGYVLKHDAEREECMTLWSEWREREGWKTESFNAYLERIGKGEEIRERDQ